jgi:hypothetical protein
VSAGDIVRAADVPRILEAGIETIAVRSPLTCRAEGGVCAACYGLDLATWELPAIGQPVGVVAGQSLGEPATQLTMRTFHVATPPKCEPKTQTSVRRDILGGLPRLTQLLDAWTGKYAGNEEERAEVFRLYAEEGPEVAADYMLTQLQKVYCEQGVKIDDRHFEIVLSQMLKHGIQGITEVAATEESFLVSGSAYGGTPALATGAAKAVEISLDTVRACTAFGKLLP